MKSAQVKRKKEGKNQWKKGKTGNLLLRKEKRIRMNRKEREKKKSRRREEGRGKTK